MLLAFAHGTKIVRNKIPNSLSDYITIMANPKKRRKIIIFSTIGLVLAALTLMAAFRKSSRSSLSRRKRLRATV